MFELTPVLFLQALGQRVEKWRSFQIGRELFAENWGPYETLHEIRCAWPSRENRTLRALLRASPNPWLAVDIWRRLPVDAPTDVRRRLHPETLAGLHDLIAMMRSALSP